MMELVQSKVTFQVVECLRLPAQPTPRGNGPFLSDPYLLFLHGLTRLAGIQGKGSAERGERRRAVVGTALWLDQTNKSLN